MIEILRSNDPVEISWAQAILADAGIDALMFDFHASIADGSIGALPRRLMVADHDADAARAALDHARRHLPDPKDDPSWS